MSLLGKVGVGLGVLGVAALGVAALATGHLREISDYVYTDVNSIGTLFEYLGNYTLATLDQMTTLAGKSELVAYPFWGGSASVLMGAAVYAASGDD